MCKIHSYNTSYFEKKKNTLIFYNYKVNLTCNLFYQQLVFSMNHIFCPICGRQTPSRYRIFQHDHQEQSSEDLDEIHWWVWYLKGKNTPLFNILNGHNTKLCLASQLNCPFQLECLLCYQRNQKHGPKAIHHTTECNISYVFKHELSLILSSFLFTWNISERSTNAIVRVVYDKWASLLDSSSVPHFTFASSESFWIVHLKFKTPFDKYLRCIKFKPNDMIWM